MVLGKPVQLLLDTARGNWEVDWENQIADESVGEIEDQMTVRKIATAIDTDCCKARGNKNTSENE
jgi:hypothetical protein